MSRSTVVVRAVMMFVIGGGTGSVVTAQTAPADRPSTRDIIVTATRSVELAPDFAEVQIGVRTRDADAARAAEQHAVIATAVRAALRSLGFPAESLPTTGYAVQPEYDPQRNRPSGYSVQSTIQVHIHDLTRVGRVIDAALGAGANGVHGLSFESTRRDAMRLQAIERAVQAAREEAAAIARAAGGRLGALLEANSGEASIPYERAGRVMALATTDTPIEPGSLQVTATVTTRWEFLPNP
ncbi:MAG: SIMPL domain-containing protein [Gemmatimonadetes bacterium]|nr:SIMPL domain-containing protein [Gemmatimonadota bacterium]